MIIVYEKNKHLEKTIKKLVLAFFLLLVITQLPIPGTTWAKESADEGIASHQLGKMVVTAQKREENIQDVPVSITAFSEKDLEDANITNMADVARFTPNVYMYESQAENVIVIRGNYSFLASIYSPTGLYVDGVAMPLHLMHNPDLYGVQRVEVLRGPQGTLYGQNTESGVINIITRQPDGEFTAGVYGDLGVYDTPHDREPYYRMGANLMGPLVQDKLFAGFSGQITLSDGFMTNDLTGRDDAAKIDRMDGRFTLRWTPKKEWDISLISDFQDWDDKNGTYRFMTGYRKADRCAINWNSRNLLERRGNGQALKINYSGHFFELTSITGHRKTKIDHTQDMDTAFLNWGDADVFYDNELWSQEVRLASPQGSSPLNWLFGLYFSHGKNDVISDYPFFAQYRRLNSKSDSQAAFGQATYTLWNKLHLTAGVRLDFTQKQGDGLFLDQGSNSTYSKDLDYCEFLPKLAVAYDIQPSLTTYASISRGYLSGGYSHAFAINTQTFTYDPEYTLNYEVGLKGQWLDGTLFADLSLYYIQITDKQVVERSNQFMVNHVRNAAEAYSRGAELSVAWIPLKGLNLQAGMGISEAKFEDWSAMDSDGSIFDYADNYTPNAPNYTYNLSAQYQCASGLFSRLDLLGVGRIYHDPKNFLEADPYLTVNLQLGYRARNWEVTLWAKNLFDEEYYTALCDWAGDTIAQDGAPRFVGVRLSYNW